MTSPLAPGDPPLADFWVTIKDPDGHEAGIGACRAHLAETKRVLQRHNPAGLVKWGPADGVVHGCKGHAAAWPES